MQSLWLLIGTSKQSESENNIETVDITMIMLFCQEAESGREEGKISKIICFLVFVGRDFHLRKIKTVRAKFKKKRFSRNMMKNL